MMNNVPPFKRNAVEHHATCMLARTLESRSLRQFVLRHEHQIVLNYVFSRSRSRAIQRFSRRHRRWTYFSSTSHQSRLMYPCRILRYCVSSTPPALSNCMLSRVVTGRCVPRHWSCWCQCRRCGGPNQGALRARSAMLRPDVPEKTSTPME